MTTVQPPPESYGPGTEVGATGEVIYGTDDGLRAFVPPPRPEWEREADRTMYREGCARCAEIPVDLAAELVRALRAAKAGGRP
jgi:hypothetical protein